MAAPRPQSELPYRGAATIVRMTVGARLARGQPKIADGCFRNSRIVDAQRALLVRIVPLVSDRYSTAPGPIHWSTEGVGPGSKSRFAGQRRQRELVAVF